MKLTRNGLILLAILCLGLFFRIYDLSTESIWLDEAISLEAANLNLVRLIKWVSRDNHPHPPLYFITLHYWIRLFGDSEFSARFLSVIFGFFAIFIMYKVGSLIFDKEVGILSSLLLGLSVFHIRYSQEVRAYSLMTLLTLLSFYFFIKLLKKRSLKVSIGYILSSILLIYTHYFGFLIIIAQNIYLFTLLVLQKKESKLELRRWISLQVTLIVLYLPQIVILTNDILGIYRGLSGVWRPEPSLHSVVNTFGVYSGSSLLFLLFLILSSFSVVNYEKIRGKIDLKDFFKSIKSFSRNLSLSNDSRIHLLVVWLLTPVILPFIISKFSIHIYWTRYTIGASLAFYLLVAKGIQNIAYKFVKLVVIGMIVTFSLVNVWGYYTEVNKDQWREVASYIDMNAEHGDLLLFYADFVQISFDYYSKRNDLVKKGLSKRTKLVEENIKSTVEGYTRVWVILAHIDKDMRRLEKDKRLIKTLSESYNLTYHEKYFRIKVYLFEKK